MIVSGAQFLKNAIPFVIATVPPEVMERHHRRVMAFFDLADIPVPCPPEREAERDRLLSEVRS